MPGDGLIPAEVTRLTAQNEKFVDNIATLEYRLVDLPERADREVLGDGAGDRACRGHVAEAARGLSERRPND
jgi:hypothetical protein